MWILTIVKHIDYQILRNENRIKSLGCYQDCFKKLKFMRSVMSTFSIMLIVNIEI